MQGTRSFASHLTRALTLVLVAMLAMSLAGCGGNSDEEPAETTPLVLASTTSTQDSGLFDALVPAFEKAYPQFEVKVIAVGTGEALKLGETKDADVLLVHAKASEDQFVANGFGTERRDVMYNDFIIVGPESDPAGLKGAADSSAAMKLLSDGEAAFVSRGDDSGTHKKELALWEAAGVEPSGDWYLSTGQGMGDTLKIASEKQGYTLADRATYLSMRDALDSAVLFEDDPALFNQYGVIPVTDATNSEGAQAFADWIVSAEGQDLVAGYGVEKFGQPLFVPNAK